MGRGVGAVLSEVMQQLPEVGSRRPADGGDCSSGTASFLGGEEGPGGAVVGGPKVAAAVLHCREGGEAHDGPGLGAEGWGGGDEEPHGGLGGGLAKAGGQLV